MLVACEFSGIVRDAFIAEGHDAISCDLLPTERPGPHIQGDVRPLLQEPWDLVIAHPPCTHLTQMTWNWGNQHRIPGWWDVHKLGVELFLACRGANAQYVAVENPPLMNPPAKEAAGFPDCVTDFMYFGEEFRKRVGLWLKNLPPLLGTVHAVGAPSLVRNRATRHRKRVASDALPGAKHQTGHERSRFSPGMAVAMAKQWGNYQ